MSGIYVHIPFCKSRCAYCGFYSTTSLDFSRKYVDAVCEELRLRAAYLSEPVSTIYFGGGTPSVLPLPDIERILNAIYKYNKVVTDTDSSFEATIECNPDDVTEDFCRFLSSSVINRVSMGVQSFSDKFLKFAGRRHNSAQPVVAVEKFRHAGVGNVSVDLIFGFPEETLAEWNDDLNKALSLDVEHISAYSLMYEEGTPLYRKLQNGEIKECDDNLSLMMFNALIDRFNDAGYEHYEISNFAKPGCRSKHNSSYWHGIPYLGVGASAHSFDRTSRQWNVSNLREYVQSISRGIVPCEREILTKDSSFDDTVMTALRTIEGISLDEIARDFGDKYLDYLKREASKHVSAKLLEYKDGGKRLALTRKGLFVSDSVMCDLMHV